jgi:hypothetical protein
MSIFCFNKQNNRLNVIIDKNNSFRLIAVKYKTVSEQINFYLRRLKDNKACYLVTSSLLAVTLATSTILKSEYQPFLLTYSMALLLSAYFQIYSNRSSDPYVHKLLKELSNKLIFTSSLILLIPTIEISAEPFLGKTFASVFASLASRSLAGILMYEKNTIFNHSDYDLSRKEAIFKTTFPQMIIKAVELYAISNAVAAWTLYSLSKSVSDFLVKSHFNAKSFIEIATRKDTYKIPFYSGEYLLGSAVDYFINNTIEEKLIPLKIIFNATSRAVGEVSYIEPISKYIIDKIGIIGRPESEKTLKIS